MTESDVKQIKKGILKILILKLLQQEKKYGYELLVEMSQKSKGFFKVKEGTLYPVLYRLLDQGFITDRKELVGRRQTRVYYHLEPAGKEHLDKLIEDYYGLVDAIQCILGPR